MAKAGSRKLPKISAKMRKEMLTIGARFNAFHSQYPRATRDEGAVDMYRGFLERAGLPPRLVDLWVSQSWESDRGCVIAAASLIDHELEVLLKLLFAARSENSDKVVNSLFAASKEHDIPPLQNTAIKIKLCFVLGLIDEQLKGACTRLQRMRSTAFAHKKEVQFIKYKDAIDLLYCFPDTFPRPPLTEEQVAAERAAGSNCSYLKFDDDNPKLAFTVAAMVVLIALELAIKSAHRQRKRRKRQKPGSVE